MNFKKWVKSIQPAGYNGGGTVYIQSGALRLLFQYSYSDKSFYENFMNKKFNKNFIFLPVFYLTMCLMKAPKNFEKIPILKI